MYRRIWRRNFGKTCFMIMWTFVGLWFMHTKWRKIVGEREGEKLKSLNPYIRLVLAVVGVRLEFRAGPSSIRGTSVQVILLPLGI